MKDGVLNFARPFVYVLMTQVKLEIASRDWQNIRTIVWFNRIGDFRRRFVKTLDLRLLQ
jgi:hypothetical protein